MKILAIDSSCIGASAALMTEECKVKELYTDGSKKHSETLLPIIKKMLDSCGIKPTDIDLFACTVGPGSFTGTRITVSVVKGLALSNNTPCVGISTLETLAYNAMDFDGIICPVINARRDTYYNAFFTAEQGKIKRICEDRQIFIDDLIDELQKINQPVIFVGDGAKACYNHVLENKLQISAQIVHENLLNIKAATIAMIASKTTNFTTPENLNTLYMHATEAERNIKT